MRSFLSCIFLFFAFLMIPLAGRAESSRGIKINHSPAPFAIKGQSLTLRAKVTGGSGGIDVVNLFYALSRDAAPFRVSMASSGMDMYVGTIEAGLLGGLSAVSYYIEAQDRGGSLEETPWYEVQFRDPDKPAPAARSGDGRPAVPARSNARPVADDEGVSGLTIGLIAGGATALGAGAYFISQDGGGGGG